VSARAYAFAGRGSSEADLGYPWLADDEIFPFFELRASAQDLRDGSDFDPDDGRRRIAAPAWHAAGTPRRHVVLGRSGAAPSGTRPTASRASMRRRSRRGPPISPVVAFAIYAAGIRSGQLRAVREGLSGRPL
jgi:hypothetical protein